MLYVSFFPQLVAGPIERASHLLPEILNERRFSWKQISSGCQLALVGFFKKMVIADNLAVIVNDIYNGPTPMGSRFYWERMPLHFRSTVTFLVTQISLVEYHACWGLSYA